MGRELCRAGVHPLEHGPDAELVAARAHLVLFRLEQVREPAVGKTLALQLPHPTGVDVCKLAVIEVHLDVHDILDLREEPRVDARQLVHFLQRHPALESISDVPDAVGTGVAQFRLDGLAVARALVHAVHAHFQPAQRLLERLLEGAADGHHLAHRFHLRGQAIVGLREFLKREARHLGDDVIDGRLERSGHRSARDLVLQFVQRVADRELGRDLGNREAGCLRGQGGRARNPRVHLDDQEPPVLRVHGELHVRAPGIHADFAQARNGSVAQNLVFLVGQRLRRRDGDRVPGVHAHRVQVFDRAHDDAVVLAVAHHLHLEFLPADNRLFDQHLASGAGVQPALDDGDELVLVVGNAAAGAAQREGRPDDGRKTDHRLHLQRFLHAVRERRARAGKADFFHRLLEFLAVLGLVDRLAFRADHLDAVLLEHAVAREIERAIQPRLPAHRRQQRVRALGRDDFLQHLPANRLDVGRIRHVRVGHDGGGIGIDQDDAVALLLQRLAGLRAGIIELARLADHDRPGADDENALDVGTLRHGCLKNEG